MPVSFQLIQRTLQANVEDVYRLVEFDHVILGIAIDQLKALEERLGRSHGIDNPRLTAANTRRNLENVRQNDSLRPRFEIINNQCVVLIVSVFASAVAELYRSAIHYLATEGSNAKLNDEEIKFTIAEIINADANLSERIGNLMEEKKDISFQDMKSIGRAFSEYFEVKIEKNQCVNNIIMAQAGRHVIVHDGANINARLRNQIANARPRTVVPELPVGGKLLFQPDDLVEIGKSMLEYFQTLRTSVEEYLK